MKINFTSYGETELMEYIVQNSKKKFHEIDFFGHSELIELCKKIEAKKWN